MASRFALAFTALATLSAAVPAASRHELSKRDDGCGQVPFRFPLSNGFPNISIPSDALTDIERAAHGTLPNGALPTDVSAGSIAAFGVIAFNEIFEVAYFTSLIMNITNEVDGYKIGKGFSKDTILKNLIAIQAQEQLHALGANAIRKVNGASVIEPCEYVFPTSDVDSAISLATTFTDLVLGTLQDVQQALGVNHDTELLPLLGSVIGQEGQQVGWYRSLESKIPSALPFLTTSAGPFAFSALNQLFIVPGSCPNIDDLGVPVFGPLMVLSDNIELEDQILQFAIPASADNSTSDLSLVYINQQNVPIVQSIDSTSNYGDFVTFAGNFPGETNLMNGLTVVAVTNSAGPFANVDEVAAATLYGPGLIEIN